jgi:hypothetical protein
VRLSRKKAAGAVAHNIVVIIYHLLTEGTCYEEARYEHRRPKQEARERQRVAAIRRRSATPCKRKEGLHQQLVLFQAYHNFVLSHASLRQALPCS